jgi:hypothetical protein
VNNWAELQACLHDQGLILDSPEALVEWMCQAKHWKAVVLTFIQQHRLFVDLLDAVIKDTDAAAQSIIHEVSLVDTDTERLSNYLQAIEEKTSHIYAASSENNSDEVEQQLAQLINELKVESDMLLGLSKHVGNVSGRVGDVHDAINRMVSVLSFKAIMDAAVSADKSSSFTQIAGEVRELAKYSATQSSEIIAFVEEMQSVLSPRVNRLHDQELSQNASQLDAVKAEINQLTLTNTELRKFWQQTMVTFNEGHSDIWGKIRMMYAQVQFQDIVRQKAERGSALLEAQLTVLQQCVQFGPTEMLVQQMNQAIEQYQSQELLHVSFSKSASGDSQAGGAMSVDLF